MKICQYCGTPNKDDASECVSCTGNMFKNQCVSCGTEFEGAFCPRCGVRVGAKPKKCPNCKQDYFTNACPTCGYTDSRPQQSVAEQEPKKRRHTALWVLGWIFCFPIPLTILIVRSQKMATWLKALLILLTWGIFVLWLQVSESDDIEETPQTQIVETVETGSSGAFTAE